MPVSLYLPNAPSNESVNHCNASISDDSHSQWEFALASQPNEFIKQGYHQPRVTLSNGKQALDPTLAKKYIPYYDQVFKGELAKTAVWLSSTKGNQVTDIVWQAISKVIYEGASVDESVSQMQSDIKTLYE